MTAAYLRFLTFAKGLSRRFIDFSVEAFEACRETGTTGGSTASDLWAKHFADTRFEDRTDEFHEMAAEILLVRTVDAFLYYLADVIGWALWRRPEVAGLQSMAEKRAVEHEIDLDDAVKEVARFHAEKVSYDGFKKMVKFIETTFAVTLAVDPDSMMNLRRIIATRNMIAHNHARKNARYCNDLGEPLENVGQRVRPSLAEAKNAADELAAFVELVDTTLNRELIEFRERA